MLTRYIDACINKIAWKLMPDGSFAAEIKELPEVRAASAHIEDSQRAFREALERFICLCLIQRRPLPEIDGHRLDVEESALLERADI